MAVSLKVSGLPVRARLYVLGTWDFRAARKGKDINFTIERASVGDTSLAINAWTVRERFLSIATWQDALRFVKKHGPFSRADEECGRPSEKETCTFNFESVQKYQESFRHFIEQESPKWLDSTHFDIHTDEGATGFIRTLTLGGYRSPQFTLEMGHVAIKGRKVPSPFLDLKAQDVWTAVYGSIYIDKMRGLRGIVCQREGCGETFLAGDPRKRFCSDTCSAYVRVTGKRTAAKEASNGKA